jgi:hypothetical protein
MASLFVGPVELNIAMLFGKGHRNAFHKHRRELYVFDSGGVEKN